MSDATPQSKRRPRRHKGVDPWEPIEGYCNARRTGGSGLCRNAAGQNTDHVGIGQCWRHGGCTPSAKKYAQRVRVEQAVTTYGLPRNIAPHDALLEEVYRTAGAVAWLEGEIRRYSVEQLVTGYHRERAMEIEKGGVAQKHPLRKIETGAAPAVLVELYQKERSHLVKVCQTAIGCGLAERQVALAEQQGQQIAEGFRAFAKRLAGVFGFDADSEPVRMAGREVLMMIGTEEVS